MHIERIEKPVSLDWWPFAALALVALPLLLFLPIGHDPIWQLWLGRKMLGGAELYRDIIEVNPPLWFWIGEPLSALPLEPRLTIILFFVAAMGLSLYLTPPRYRLPSLAVMLLIPVHDFGQREHFTLIATIPFVLSRKPRPGAGIFAAVGLCLKPYFLLVPVALWLFDRRFSVALVCAVSIYALAIPIFAPAYIDELPMLRRFYEAFGQTPDYHWLSIAFLLAAVGAILSRREGSPESRACLVASLAFVPAVLVQAKGFGYHSIPVRGFLALAILIELMRDRRNPFGDGLIVGSAVLCCVPLGVYHNRYQFDAEQHLAGLEPGSSVVALVTNPSMVWPMVDRFNWQLRAFSVWQLDAAVRNPALLPEIRSIYAPDLAKRPDLLIIDNRPVLGPLAHQLLPPNYLKCYSLKLRTALMESYRRVC